MDFLIKNINHNQFYLNINLAKYSEVFLFVKMTQNNKNKISQKVILMKLFASKNSLLYMYVIGDDNIHLKSY